MSKAGSPSSGDELGLTLQEALNEHPEWERENPGLVDWINSMSKAALVHRLKEAFFTLDCLTKIVIPVAENNAAFRAKWQTILEHARAIRAFAQRDSNLAKGRKAGVKSRTEAAKKTKDNLIEAIQDLFDTPDKPGWGWSNTEITRFLEPKFGRYSEGTICQVVKREAAKHRKARKEAQARKLPNR